MIRAGRYSYKVVRRSPKPVGATGITIRGQAAIEAAEQGATLYVLNPQKGWIVGGPGALERAKKLAQRGGWIYGVHEDWKNEVRA